MSKRAVILAGGLGSRLKPYTISLPKPLMSLGKYAIIEVIILQLIKAGFDHITLSLNHRAELIQQFINEKKWAAKIDFYIEKVPLATIGPLKLIKDLPDNFLVMNGDILTTLDYSELYNSHIRSGVKLTVSAYQYEQVIPYGVFETNKQGQLLKFEEKPRRIIPVSMGINILSKAILDHVPEHKSYGFDHLVNDLMSNDVPINVYDFKGEWCDIGDPEVYLRATESFEKYEHNYL